MGNKLALIKSENFNGVHCDFYQGGAGEVWLTRRQIGEALGYRTPDDAIYRIHDRHKDRLEQFSVLDTLSGTDGKQYETFLYSWKGLYETCRWSTKPKANQFIDWAWGVIEAIRKGEMTRGMERAVGKAIRRTLTDAIRDSGLNEIMHGFAYKNVTDLAYKVAIGCTAAQYRKTHGLDKDANVREYLDAFQLKRVEQAEKLAQVLADVGTDYDHIRAVLNDTFPRLALVAKVTANELEEE